MVDLSSFAGACQAISVVPSATGISISLTPFRPAASGANSCWIGEIHQQAVAEIGCRANCSIDRDEPYNERHNITASFLMLLSPPALSQR